MASEFEFTSLLIQYVSENKCLYDKNDLCYFNKNEKEKAWVDISNKIGKHLLECKKKWKLLRERYSRELKKAGDPLSSGSTETGEWALFKSMDFLKDSVTPRRPRCNEFMDDVSPDETSCEVDVPTFTSPPPPKRAKVVSDDVYETLNKAANLLVEDISTTSLSDSTDLYLKTVNSLMRELPTPARDQFMSETFVKLMEFRAKYVNQTNANVHVKSEPQENI